MLACVDVSYTDSSAIAGCLLFPDWSSSEASAEFIVTNPLAGPYVPGQFYLRELPPLAAVLARVHEPLEAVVIDGYVWLGGARPGLGARLFAALGGRLPVVGVAKTAWGGEGEAGADGSDLAAANPHRSVPLARGASKKPLFVTAVGTDVAEAARHIGAMHGAHRIPTMLKAVDRLVRDEAARTAPT